MCDCKDQSGDCQLCVCGRGVSGAEAEALTAQLLQNADTEQAAQKGRNLQIDRNALDSTLAKVVAQRKPEEKKGIFGIFAKQSNVTIRSTSSPKKSNVTIGSTSSIGEKKSLMKSLSQVFFDESKTQKGRDTKTSNVTKSISKSNVSEVFDTKGTTHSDTKSTISDTKSTISDTKSTGQIKLEKHSLRRKHQQDYKEHINADIVETIAKRVEHAEKANKLNIARVRYEKKAKAMEKQEKETVSYLSEKKRIAEETKEFREQQKKEARERQIRTMNRTDAFIDHAEERDAEFARKKAAEIAAERERLLRASKYMPSKTSWTTKILAFAGTTFLAAGIIGFVYRCFNVAVFKESAQTAVDNVITAIVEHGQTVGQSAAWAFGPESGGDCVPRNTGKTPKVIDSKIKWPIDKPPIKFVIPGMNNCDEGEEGDFLFDDEEDYYEDDNSTGPTTSTN